MTERYDAIVIGAGHNGLVCATLLARAGKSVLLLEANEQVGGAAVTREFSDGFSVSACAHLLYQLQPKVMKELGIKPKLLGDDLKTIALAADGNHVSYDTESVAGVSDTDVASYKEFAKRMRRFAAIIRRLGNRPPPRLGSSHLKDTAALARLGVDMRLLGRANMRELLRVVGMNIHDELTERFENPLLKGALSVDATLGTHLGPRSPTTMLTYLHRLAANDGRVSQPAGGMGKVTALLAQAAREAGVQIETGRRVLRIIAENGRVTGVQTEDGECYDSYTVVSNADPKTTTLDLLGARHVETGFAKRVGNIRANGNAAKLHLALDGLPAIAGLQQSALGERIVIAPDEHYVERAFNPAKYGEFSTQPVIEMTFPSVRDETLAPAGKHVMSAIVQYVPYELRAGWDDAARADLMRAIFDVLATYAPDLEERVTASELLTPVDIEREFHIGGGHWHHGELSLDQFLFVRPVGGAAQYRMPIDGLFLCGAGAHPGGGVSGAAGRNAARSIIRLQR